MLLINMFVDLNKFILNTEITTFVKHFYEPIFKKYKNYDTYFEFNRSTFVLFNYNKIF